jgi:Cytochrome c
MEEEMLSKIRNSMVMALILTLILVIPVLAGGWAVIILDELPSNLVVGKPFTIGFTVLQHGRTPMTDLHPKITATLNKEQELVMDAEPEGKPGHYVATVTLPKQGEWQWSVQAFTMDQKMPALSVAAPSTVSASEPVVPIKAQATSTLTIVRVLSVVIGILALAIAFRSRSRLALALTVVCITVGVASLMTGAAVPAVEAQSKLSDESADMSSVSQIEYGRQLFLAKGCITCHYNSKAASTTEYWTIEMGAPNLSKFSANPEVIAMRLKDPSSVKSDTQMPNLDLKKDEIEALVAFINSK